MPEQAGGQVQLKLIVGLGNPGRHYANNRHNVGFMCISLLGKLHGIAFDRKKANARIGVGQVAGVPVTLARPQTYMNASGRSVKALLGHLNIGCDNLIVVHDDLDLPPGRIRIRKGGSSGGHKGIESIILETGSAAFTRVRIGIGRPVLPADAPETEASVIEYVLGDFTPSEYQAISQALPRASEAIACLLAEGLIKAMNRYNPPV